MLSHAVRGPQTLAEMHAAHLAQRVAKLAQPSRGPLDEQHFDVSRLGVLKQHVCRTDRLLKQYDFSFFGIKSLLHFSYI